MNLARPIALIFSITTLALAGCANNRQPYDYTALKESAPRSIVVIPPANNSVEIDAPYIYLSTITRPLAEKGYYVFPVSVVEEFMKENGLPTTAEMNLIPLDKLGKIIGADAALYITIDQWGQKYQITSSVSVVTLKMKLVDIKTGNLLWSAEGSAQRGSGDGGGGLIGALVAAVISQVASIDITPQLSRQINNQEINNRSTGLLNGPYRPRKPEI